MKMIRKSGLALAMLCASALSSQACDITIGMVMELTGPAGAYGQAGAKSVEMAFRDLNEAGGVLGCNLVTDTRDSQSQGNVAVDQATQLVNVKQVPVVIGGIISSVSIPDPDFGHRRCGRRAGVARILQPDADAAQP
jgi:ABC-type branched-subunit amino acid transport system substrate-binding protein